MRNQIGDRIGQYIVADIVFDEANPKTGSIVRLKDTRAADHPILSLPVHSFTAMQADASQPLWVSLDAYFASRPAPVLATPAKPQPKSEPNHAIPQATNREAQPKPKESEAPKGGQDVPDGSDTSRRESGDHP